MATHPSTGLAPLRQHSRAGVFYRLTASTILASILLLGAATVAFADEIITYKIQDGDSLLALADRFGVNSDELAALNGLTDPDILTIGQPLLYRVFTAANPFGLTVPDRREAIVEEVQLAREPASTTAGLVEDAPLPPSLIKMIATIGPVRALQLWRPSPSHPAIMPAPSYSQFDGSFWQSSNCGPTALSMALGAIGISADQISLRRLANDQMDSYGSAQGMSWEALVSAAQSSGAGTKGLVGGNGYRSWAVEDLKRELALGHPVLLLLRYRLMPDHYGSSYYGDHYVVSLGFDQNGNLVYNDPAGTVAHGDRRRLSPAELDDAWSNTWAGQVRTGLALYR